ncbi:MAG: SulP family inorganic anion transporter [Eubacteriales bacterium]|nr:SulP family inorganic anion transporter [Eubacteriales bacterium]
MRYVQMLKREFKGYNGKSFTADLLSGITVAAVALPLALAFGVSSGADAAAGLITAIIAGLVISMLSGGYYQISGPTGAMAAILMSVVARYGMQGVFVATFLAGAVLVLCGVLKLGRLTSFIPMPVITGFTSGIAVIIALGQVDNFFGVASQGETAVAKLLSYGTLGFSPDWTAVIMGLCVILFMAFFPKKWNAVVPASLISIILATAVSMLFHLDVKSVGAIPTTLLPDNRLTLAGLDMNTVQAMISPAFSIAVLGMIESLLCGASAGRMTGVKLDSDQELIAQGIGNMALPFFGGIPATAAIARTSVAIKSGAKTRLTGVFHALALLVFMLALSPVMSQIPLCALAGVLMVTAWRMNEWHAIRFLLSRRLKSSILMFFATMIATIVFDLTIAILIGVGLGVIVMLSRLSHLEIKYADVDCDRLDIQDAKTRERLSGAVACYVNGPIMFANAQAVEQMADKLTDCHTVFMSLRGCSDMDVSGAQAMVNLAHVLRGRGTALILTGLPEKAKLMADRCGLTEEIGEEHFYHAMDRAILGYHAAAQATVED